MFLVLQKSYTTDILSSNDRDDGERLEILLAGEHDQMYRNLNKKGEAK